MMESESSGNDRSDRRSVFISVLCFFSFIFSGVMFVFFLLISIYSDRIIGLMNMYLPAENQTPVPILLLSLAGALLHGLIFTGTLLIWRLRRTGYYLLGVSSLIMAGYHLLLPQVSWMFTAVYIILVVCFGIFYKRFH